MFLTELDISERSIDLFDCLSEKEKARGKRKGIRMAKREDFFYKCRSYIEKKFGIARSSNRNEKDDK